MNLLARLSLAAAIGLAVGAAGYAAAGPSPAPPLGPDPVTVVVDVEHSTFRPSHLRVTEGTEVRFVITNGDPINHEFITGPPEVHQRHSTGTEKWHPPVPGEVSLGPGERGVTTYAFDEVGRVEFACHLPGHLEHGMRGVVDVVAAG